MNINDIAVGDKIKFVEEKQAYTVRAKGRRFLICTKPFNLLRTVLYTIVDTQEMRRGPEGLVFEAGAETQRDRLRMLIRVERGRTELSYRRSIQCKIDRIVK